MPGRTSRSIIHALGLLLVVGCSSVTGSDWLRDFSANPLPNPETVVPGVEATSALSILYIQGLMQTPTACYALAGEFSKNGDNLTLRVNATPSGTGCGQEVGAFRYNAVVGDLKRRTYQLQVIHEVDGAQVGQFTQSVDVVQ